MRQADGPVCASSPLWLIVYWPRTPELRFPRPQQVYHFVLSCIRNPLDVTVSLVLQVQDRSQRQVLSRAADGSTRCQELSLDPADRRRLPAYFRRAFRRPIPYDNFSREAHGQFDFVMRSENLSDDFAKVLGMLGIEPIRPLPVVNRTTQRGGISLPTTRRS